MLICKITTIIATTIFNTNVLKRKNDLMVERRYILIKLYINKKIIIDYSPDVLFTYILLKLYGAEKLDYIIISNDLLLYNFFNDISIDVRETKNRTLLKTIQSGLENLINIGKVVLLDSNNKYYSINCSLLNDTNYSISKDNAYCIIDSEEIRLLAYYFKNNTVNIKLLQLFCYIISTINTKGSKKGISFVTYNEIIDSLNMSYSTVIKYLKILENIGLLYIYRSDKYITDYETNKMVGINNIYSRLIDKDKCISAALEYENKYANNQKANKKEKSFRSWSLKYLWICKGKQYSESEAKEIYKHIKKYNENFKGTEYVKDLSVFKKYSFYDDSC